MVMETASTASLTNNKANDRQSVFVFVLAEVCLPPP